MPKLRYMLASDHFGSERQFDIYDYIRQEQMNGARCLSLKDVHAKFGGTYASVNAAVKTLYLRGWLVKPWYGCYRAVTEEERQRNLFAPAMKAIRGEE